MKHSIAKLAVAALAVTVSSVTLAQTAAGTPPGVRAAKPSVARDVGTESATTRGRVPVRTWMASGNGFGSALTAFDFNLIDTTSVGCFVDAGCQIGVGNMTQITPAGGNWAICLYVNGVTLSCQFQGLLPGVSSFVVGNARGVSATVPRGTHVVETKIYVEGATAALNYWQTDITVYKP